MILYSRSRIIFTTILAFFVFLLSSSARESTKLLDNWRFKYEDISEAKNPTFDDSSWQPISVPHNWGWEKAQIGEQYQRGAGWYRRNLDIGRPQPGRRYFVRFEAAGSVADVYLNGKSLGQHRGAFGAFCFELTRDLSTNGTNILAVRASNAPEPDLAPLSGDFPVYGGLYRNVHLIETDEACFTLTDHGSPGVAWLQTSVNADEALIDLTVQISNGTRQKQARTFVARIVDADGKTVASAEQALTLTPMSTDPHSVRLTVKKPHLWHGRKDPYLHRAIVELRGNDGNVRDSVEQTLGFRSFRVDPDKGFFLNDQPYHLHGVNRHQDRPDKGWAISEGDQDEDLALILEMGSTVLRLAHYQHSDYVYSQCDKNGLLVWAELPQVDRISAGNAFADTSRRQLLDLIRQNINHSSIFCWSLHNELRPGNWRNPDPQRLLQDLKVLANGEDPTRPTIAATATGDLPQMNKITDLLGWNVYYGWYGDWPPLQDFDSMRAGYRYSSRHGGYCISEYGAGANVKQHEQHPKQPKNDGQWHPEEYQNELHEVAWKNLKAAPYIWGTFVWVMFDFSSYWRNEGGIKGRNDKGLVTYDRQTKKDSFYFYKANWSEEPVLYISSRRHTERTNAVTDIKIYSNAQTAELMINGVTQGKRTNDGNAVLLWKDLQLNPGENRIEAKAERNGRMMTDSCVWKIVR